MKIFTVRKRPLTGISKRGRPRQALKGAIYVPNGWIHQRVVVIEATEYTELLQKSKRLDKIRKISSRDNDD